MDISNLTYKELETLEEEIKERKKEIAKNRYRFLVGGVLNSINAIKEAGCDYINAFYDDNGEAYDWKELSFVIQEELKRREREDY